MLSISYILKPTDVFFKPNTSRDYINAYRILRYGIFIDHYNSKNGFNILTFKIHSQTDEYVIYYVSIATKDNKLTPNSKVKVQCSCPDFNYTFAYVLYKNNSIVYPDDLPEIFKTVPPRKRNPKFINGTCKHIYTITRFCLEKNISFAEDEALKYNKFNKVKDKIYHMMFKFYKMMDSIRNKKR